MFDFNFDLIRDQLTSQQRRSLLGMIRSTSFAGRLAAGKFLVKQGLARWDVDDCFGDPVDILVNV